MGYVKEKVCVTVNNKGFQLIFAEHNRMVTSYLHTLVGDWHQACDLAQETFVVAYRRMDDFDPSRSLAAWLRGIARNQARNFLRQRARNRLVVLENADVERLYEALDHSNGDGTWENRLHVLDACIERLPERQREYVESHYLENKSGSVIAAERSIKARTVFQILWHARQALRECIERSLRKGGVREQRIHAES